MEKQIVLEGAKRKRLQEELLEILACPTCKSKLTLKVNELDLYDFLFCRSCDRKYYINDGIPSLLPPELQLLLDEQERDASLSIKEANMGYGAVYHEESTSTTQGTIISSTCLIPRSMDFILKQLNGLGTRILETCCAQGTTASYLYDKGFKPFCFDISHESIVSLQEHHPNIDKLFIADVENMPILPNSFDTVIFNGALHHLPNPRHALTEAFRVLKSGGQVLIVEPNNYRNEVIRVILKVFMHPRSALIDLKRTWHKILARISGKDTIEYDGKKYQKDGDGRWLKYDEMDQEISLPYILRIVKSIGFKVPQVQVFDITIVPFRLFKPNPGVEARRRLARIDSVLNKIPLVNTCGEILHIILQKP